MLWQLQKLLSPEEAGEALDSNIDCFHKAKAIVKILLTSKVCKHVYTFVYVQYSLHASKHLSILHVHVCTVQYVLV